jgi:hypothetical protein
MIRIIRETFLDTLHDAWDVFLLQGEDLDWHFADSLSDLKL